MNFLSTSSSLRGDVTGPEGTLVEISDEQLEKWVIPGVPKSSVYKINWVIPDSRIKEKTISKSSKHEIIPITDPSYLDPEICTITQDFEIDKKLLKEEFYSNKNKEKRQEFFKTYSKEQRNKIQEEYYSFLNQLKTQICFFDWYENFKTQKRKINMVKNEIIVSKEIKLKVRDTQVTASPFKIKSDPPETINGRDAKNIIEQNNFTNQNLKTIRDQLIRIEKIVKDEKYRTSSQKNSLPIFKPFEISKKQSKELKNTDFLDEINKRLEAIEVFQRDEDTPEQSDRRKSTPVLAQNVQDKIESHAKTTDDSLSDQSAQEEISPIDLFETQEIHKIQGRANPQRPYYPRPTLPNMGPKEKLCIHQNQRPCYPRPTLPDMGPEEKPFIHQNQYSAQEKPFTHRNQYSTHAIYEWNIDGLTEYNILNVLQKMTMISMAYKTKGGASDHAIAQVLVAGFTGQLRGWWDYYLDDLDRHQILFAIKKTADGQPIKDDDGSNMQDAVATLVSTIAKHFIGDPSKFRDKTSEILTNLKCKKLQDFKWYKDVFLTNIFTRDDCNKPFWKEKFLAGLPIVFSEKIRTKLRNQNNGRIPYDKLTYGDLVNIINEEILNICNELRLKQQLKRELSASKKELDSFYEQFGLQPLKQRKSFKKIC